ncbi:hypothetical protein [Bacillus sp. JCM 19041]|uniref:hypothetical protein n=1 Tax=Bacillus sp. JCM 19041 TaxID=1460637 RepID=UPI0006D0FBFF
MARPALSQWEAFMVETLLAKGMSKQTLIQHIKNEDANALNAFDQTFNYSDLIQTAQKIPKTLLEAVETGYTIKFVSNFGIKRLLGLKFGFEDGVDYHMSETRFNGLTLSENQLHVFQQMLSPNWKLFSEKNKQEKYDVAIIHATAVEQV